MVSGSGEGAIVTSMVTVLESRAFRDGAQEWVRWEGSGRDLDAMVPIVDKAKGKCAQHEAVEAANKAAAGRNEHR